MATEAIDKVFLNEVLKKFIKGYESQKKLLACNTTPPNERNAYFSLCNAIYHAAGRKDVIAATEMSLGKNRRIDAVFIINKTMYMIELKIATDRVTKNEKSSFRTAIEKTEYVCTQLDSIDAKSSFILNANRNRDIGIDRVVCVGMIIGNLRYSESLLETSFASKTVVKAFGEKWLTAAEKAVHKKYTIMERGFQSTGTQKRMNSKAEGHIEAGSIGFIFGRVLKVF